MLFSKASDRVLPSLIRGTAVSHRSVRHVGLKVTAVRADGKPEIRQDTVDKHNTATANINDKELENKFVATAPLGMCAKCSP